MPVTGYADQKASNRAPFVLITFRIIFLLCLINFDHPICAADSDSEANCSTKTFDETVTVDYIYDGDTIHLSDGRKLRLIGINTPEHRRDDNPGEPFSNEAKAQLQTIVNQNNGQLKLVLDSEQYDGYNRVLAHIFTLDGTNITTRLLQYGLGFSIAIPPNLKFLNCYQIAENYAKQLKNGMWGHSFTKPMSATELPPSTQGFQQIIGSVESIRESSASLWLNLSKSFSIRIPKKDFIYFTNYQPASLINKRLIATSWIYKQKNKQRMTIHHPAALQVLNAD